MHKAIYLRRQATNYGMHHVQTLDLPLSPLLILFYLAVSSEGKNIEEQINMLTKETVACLAIGKLKK